MQSSASQSSVGTTVTTQSNGTIKKMIKKCCLLMMSVALLLLLAPVLPTNAVSGYQWIIGYPDGILEEKYNATSDERETADEYFSDGAQAEYPLIGYNCNDNDTLPHGSPDCEKYYYYAQDSGSRLPTFTEFCTFIDNGDNCGTGSDQLLVGSPTRGCRQSGFSIDGGSLVCTSVITIIDTNSVASEVESTYGIDFDSLPEVAGLDEGMEEAPEEDPGGDPIGEEGEPEGEPCYDGDLFGGGGVITGIVGKGMRWIVCETAQLIGQAIDGLNEVIVELLDFNPTSDSNDSLQAVWGNILRFANILFVIAFLIMIISTALDLGIFSNYTVKKLLPRIILAALLANLSWYVATVMIDITNAVGAATKDIILSPLETLSNNSFSLANTDNATVFQEAATKAEGAGAFHTGVVVGLGTLIYFTLASFGAVLLPVIAAAFIAVIIAFGALLLRRIILVLLIIFAPLAFALWALPNGDKIMQRWWKLFVQMLLMYPIIMALFASGIFISQLLIGDGETAAGLGPFTAVTAFIALILPYLLIPTIFKLAGGFLGNITGMINDRGKGLVDRGKKWRDEGSQYGRRKQLKAQRKNFTGHEKLLHSIDADKLAGSKFLASRRRAMGLGRAWAQGDMAKETQRNFLAKTKAAVSKEQMEAASYLSRAVAGGIDSKGIDGKGRKFLVTRKDGSSFMTGKDAAVAEAWLGGKVEALDESLDASGKIKYGKSAGTLFDGSEASQRAAGQIAGAQALTPVIDTVRNGGGHADHGWRRWDRNGNELTTTDASGNTVADYSITSLYDQYRAAPEGSPAQHAAAGANMVLAEVKDGYAQNLSGKMPSFVKGENLAFHGVQAGALAGFHENEVSRMVGFAQRMSTSADADERRVGQETWSRIGQSMKQIVDEPSKYNMSPTSLARLKRDYDAHVAAGGTSDPTLHSYMGRVNKNGTLS